MFSNQSSMEYHYQDATQLQSLSSEGSTTSNSSMIDLVSDGLEMENASTLPLTVAGNRDETIVVWELMLLAIMFCTAVVGNSLVIVALVIRRKKLTRMYYFILHLCVSDLIVAFLHILPQLCWEITYRFKGNNFLCKTTKILQLFGPYLSSYVLVATAIDRYLAICFPMSSSPWTVRHSQRMVWVAWVVAALLSLPQGFIFSYQQLDNLEWDCWGSFLQPYGQRAYVTYFCIANTVPLVVLVFTYSSICWAVWVNFRHKKNAPEGDFNGVQTSPPQMRYKNHQAKGASKETTCLTEGSETVAFGRGSERTPINPRIHSLQGISRAKIKTVKLTIVVIVCYIICSMPYTCAMLWLVYTPNVEKTAFYNGIGIALLTLLASLNSCVNPWVYLGFNENLVQSLRGLLCCRDRDQHNSQRFLPTQYSRSSISDVVSGHKIVNLGNGVVGWSAGGKPNYRSDRSPNRFGISRNTPPKMTPALERQNTRTTSLTDDRCSERALLTSPSPSVSTITSDLALRNLGGESPSDESCVSRSHNGHLRRDSVSAPANLVCSDQHEEHVDKEHCCGCEEV